MSSSSSISLTSSSARCALADHQLRLDHGLVADEVGGLAERGLGLLDRLGAHDVLDAHPLGELARHDDVEEHQPRRRCAGARRPAKSSARVHSGVSSTTTRNFRRWPSAVLLRVVGHGGGCCHRRAANSE